MFGLAIKGLEWLAVTCLLLAASQTVQAEGFSLESAGGRFGFCTRQGGADFHQAEAFLNWNLPWGWDLGRNFWLQSRVDFTAGWLGDSHSAAAIGSAGPSLQLQRGKFPVSFELGISPALMSRSDYASRELGSIYQFTSHVGLNFDVASHVRLSYRFQHMSDGGLAEPNPGLNLHFFGVSYLF